MPVWNPADLRRRRPELRFSADDRRRADDAMNPLPRTGPDGHYDADAVFEGGGVLGTAFLGAVRAAADLGVRWHGLAGTSAGAITAALLAADMNIDLLEQVLGRLDFRYFVSKKTSGVIFNGDPADDLDQPLRLVMNLSLAGQLGEYSAEPFRGWLDEMLKWAGKPTFGDVWDRSRSAADRQLKVVVSDLTRGEMRVLPDDLEPPKADPAKAENLPGGRREYRPPLTPRQRAFSVAEAVRLSMSIPFFFEPGTLETPEGRSTIVDGGILSNFPLWIYDDVAGRRPEWPTFGFRLIDRNADAPARIDGVGGLFKAMLKTMMHAGDRRYLSQRHQGRVIDIDLTGLNVSATQFGLSNEMKDELYARGYLAAKTFFTEQWNWTGHLRARGF